MCGYIHHIHTCIFIYIFIRKHLTLRFTLAKQLVHRHNSVKSCRHSHLRASVLAVRGVHTLAVVVAAILPLLTLSVLQTLVHAHVCKTMYISVFLFTWPNIVKDLAVC